MLTMRVQRITTVFVLLGIAALCTPAARAIDVVSGTDVWIRDVAPDSTYENDFLDVRRLIAPLNGSVPVEVRYGLVDFDLGGLSGTTVTSVEFHVDHLDLDDTASVGSSADLPIEMIGFLLDMNGAASIGSTTWNSYQTDHAGQETEFEGLGSLSLPASGQSEGGLRFATGTAADIAIVQEIIDNGGTLTMVLQPTSPGYNIAASFGDLEAAGENSFLRINEVTPPVLFPSSLELHVNQFTGRTQMVSVGGTADVELDGYTMRAYENLWVPGAWNSLTDQSSPGWEEVTPAPPLTQQLVLSELNLQSSQTVNPSEEISLGNVYTPSGEQKYIDFEYTVAGDTNVRTGNVVFEGEGLRLRVAKPTGRIDIVNSEAADIEFESYSIASPDNELNLATWSSLEDQGISDWVEANPSSGALTELNLGSSSVIGAYGSMTLGSAYAGGGSGNENLEFVFDLVGPGGINDGIVEYILLGDMNGDGVVDMEDTPLFVQALVDRAGYDANGFTTAAGYLVDADAYGDINGDGSFDLGDISGFSAVLTSGSTSSSAVPEPGSAWLLVIAAIVAWIRLRTCGIR